MNPRRVVEQYPNSLGAQLLRAGRALEPPESAYRKTLAGVGLLAMTLGKVTEVGAAVVQGGSSPLFGSVIVKWGTLSIIAAACVVGGVRLTGRTPVVANASSAPVASHASETRLRVIPQPLGVSADVTKTQSGGTAVEPTSVTSIERVAPVKPEPIRAVSNAQAVASAPRVSTREDSLGEEVSVVEAARRAVEDQRAALALQLLDNYAKRFTRPRLAQEAAYLRVRALKELGRDSDARDAFEQFRERYPGSALGEPH